MKYLLLIPILALLAGCSVGYNDEDLANDTRQDLVGYVLGLDGHSETEYEEYTKKDYFEGQERIAALKNN